jgi:hypothetical protein
MRTTVTRVGICSAVIGTSYEACAAKLPPRDSLPEPFDISDHINSVIDSSPLGIAASYAVLRAIEYLKPRASPRQKRAAMVTGALALGAAVNSIVEFKFGQSLVSHDIVEGIFNTDVRDPIDMVYGTLAAGACSYVISPDISPAPQTGEVPLG